MNRVRDLDLEDSVFARRARRPRPSRGVDVEDGRPNGPEVARLAEPLSERISDASPLLMVSIACFALGGYLHWTASTGPVAALPIWALFLALGLVASVGAGWAALPEDAEVEEPSSARRRAPQEGAEVPAFLADAPESPLIVETEATENTVESTPSVPESDARTFRPEDRPVDEDWPEPRSPATSDEMIEEIDGLLRELRPSRRGSHAL